MSDADYERGQTDARLDMADERHRDNIKRFTAIETKLDGLLEMMAVVKGGWRVLFAVGSISAAIGAFLNTIVRYVSEHWK